jgi:hypothetical protein
MLNQAIFHGLYVDDDQIVDHRLREPFGQLHAVQQARQTTQATLPEPRTDAQPQNAKRATNGVRVLLRGVVSAPCSSKTPRVELLTTNSHSTQAADLRLCHTVALTSPVRAPNPSARRPWSLHERLDEGDITKLITAYRNGTTAASLATAHGVSLSSVKRLLHTASARRAPSIQ